MIWGQISNLIYCIWISSFLQNVYAQIFTVLCILTGEHKQWLPRVRNIVDICIAAERHLQAESMFFSWRDAVEQHPYNEEYD